jgi:hypothetical protein
MHVRRNRLSLARAGFGYAVVCLLVACGGGTKESPPPQRSEDPEFVVMKDGKPAWPPVGPGCDTLIACCKEAAPGRPEVNLACQMSAVEPNCPLGRKAVIELLENGDVSVPAACRR